MRYPNERGIHMKKALITGIRGQDGAYLAKLLLEKGYDVFGVDRRNGESSYWRLKDLGIEKEVKVLYMDLLELTNVMRTIDKTGPDEIYNLAAQSFVQVSFEQPLLTSEIDAMGVLRLLESLRTIKPNARFYQASTSEMFGLSEEMPQKETTPFCPRSPYAIAKLFGHWMTVSYRKSYNMFACSGILFNHESPLRGLEFVSRKITYGVANIKRGLQDKIILGNLDSKRDWGYAKEYVEGMWLMLQQKAPDDFVLATGETHTVRDFVEAAFRAAGYNIGWKGKGVETKGIDMKSGRTFIEISRDFYRPTEVDILIGNPQKALEKLGWKPLTAFESLVGMMVEADIKRLEKETR